MSYYSIENNLHKVKEQLQLTDIDVILIENWYNTKPKEIKIDLEESLTRIVSDRAMYLALKELNNKASKSIWDKGSINLLNAIFEQKTLQIGFMSDQFEVLPKEMLPRLSSFDKMKNTDFRSKIAKALGCTIVM